MYYYDLMELFYQKKIKYLIVGGLAVNLHGVPRMTQDIDIVLSPEKDNIFKAVNILTSLKYSPKIPVNPLELAEPEKVSEWILTKNMIAFSFYNENDNLKTVDIIISYNFNFNDAYENADKFKINEIEILTASIDDIIKMKSITEREQDKSDIEMLKKVKQIREIENG